MSTNEKPVSMGRRALLTEHERDALLDRKSDDARYVAVSRIRKKIDEELTRDVEVLRQHDEEHGTELLKKLRAAVSVNSNDDTEPEMPICTECSYKVINSSDDRGDYFCTHCNAVLREQDVRYTGDRHQNDIAVSNISSSTTENETSLNLPAETSISEDTWKAVDEISEGWDTDSRLKNRRMAAATALEYALTHAVHIGKSSDVIEAIRTKYPVDGQNAETWWRKNVRPIFERFGKYSKAKHGYAIENLEEISTDE